MKCDYKSFHAVMMGFLARDREFLRIARMDVHSYLCSYMVGQPASPLWSDEDLNGYLKEIRRYFPDIRDKNAKQAVLGWQLGMEGGTLFTNNPGIYAKRKDADAAIDLINNLFQGCVRYRKEKMLQAHKQGFLLSPYRYLRWFWDVFRTCPQCHYQNRERCGRCKGLGLVIGEEAKEAISHDVQSCAHGHIKDVMLRLEEQGINERANLVNQVHDDLEFDVPEEEISWLVPSIKKEMEKPNPLFVDPELAPDGLAFQVDIKIGDNLVDMEDWK